MEFSPETKKYIKHHLQFNDLYSQWSYEFDLGPKLLSREFQIAKNGP